MARCPKPQSRSTNNWERWWFPRDSRPLKCFPRSVLLLPPNPPPNKQALLFKMSKQRLMRAKVAVKFTLPKCICQMWSKLGSRRIQSARWFTFARRLSSWNPNFRLSIRIKLWRRVETNLRPLCDYTKLTWQLARAKAKRKPRKRRQNLLCTSFRPTSTKNWSSTNQSPKICLIWKHRPQQQQLESTQIQQIRHSNNKWIQRKFQKMAYLRKRSPLLKVQRQFQQRWKISALEVRSCKICRTRTNASRFTSPGKFSNTTRRSSTLLFRKPTMTIHTRSASMTDSSLRWKWPMRRKMSLFGRPPTWTTSRTAGSKRS